MNRRQWIVLLLSVLGVLVLLWSAADFFALMRGDRLGGSFCSVNAYWNCDRASLSPLGSIAMIPLGIFGALWFWMAAVLAFAPSKLRILFRAHAVAGLIVIVILSSYLFFRLQAGCITCVSSYILLLGVVAAGWNLKSGLSFKKTTTLGCAVLGLLVVGGYGVVNRLSLDGRISDSEFQKWYERIQTMPTLSDLVHGNPEAKITVMEFSDFGCPFCGFASETLIPYLADQEDVKIVYYPFPLDSTCNSGVDRQVHRYSCDWAKGALCAHEQGKLWEYHQKAFKIALSSGELPTLDSAMSSLGLDEAALRACLKKPEIESKLRDLIQVGLQSELSSTPTFIINGRKFTGLMPMGFAKRFLEELRKDVAP